MVIFIMDKRKKFIVINIFLTFIIGFIVHGMYEWFPCVLTTVFPVNESLYEHMKLIFLSPIISSIILYFYFKRKDFIIHNFLFGLMVSTIFNIILFYLIYLPFYYEYGAIMWITLLIYFITIIMSQYLYYLIISMDNNKKLNLISGISLLIIMIILTYFTYHPLKIDFFRDPENNSYGIKK